MKMDFNHKDPSGIVGKLIDAELLARQKKETPRNYLGGSRLGHHCERALQYEFFNAPKDKGFPARILRIFRRGHECEEWMIQWMRAAGIDLRTEKPGGGQYGFSVAGGRIAGHVDGIIVGGSEELGPFPRLWECKCLGAKGWNKLVKTGLKSAYPVYEGQCQIYMAYLQLDENPALFTAVNADSMEIYSEDVSFDGKTAQDLSDRGVRVLRACDAGELLPRIGQDSSWHECRFCDYSLRCWS